MKVYIGLKKQDDYIFENIDYGSIEGARVELATNPMYYHTDNKIFVLDEKTGEMKDAQTYEQDKAIYDYYVYESACKELGKRIFDAYHDDENVSKVLIDFVKELIARDELTTIGQFIGKKGGEN